MTSLHSSATSTVTPQSPHGLERPERTVTLDPRDPGPLENRASRTPAHPAARRGSPDPLQATDRYRLTVPFVDRIR